MAPIGFAFINGVNYIDVGAASAKTDGPSKQIRCYLQRTAPRLHVHSYRHCLTPSLLSKLKDRGPVGSDNHRPVHGHVKGGVVISPISLARALSGRPKLDYLPGL